MHLAKEYISEVEGTYEFYSFRPIKYELVNITRFLTKYNKVQKMMFKKWFSFYRTSWKGKWVKWHGRSMLFSFYHICNCIGTWVESRELPFSIPQEKWIHHPVHKKKLLPFVESIFHSFKVCTLKFCHFDFRSLLTCFLLSNRRMVLLKCS